MPVLAILMVGAGASVVAGQSSVLSDAIRNRLEAGRSRGEWTAAGEKILAVQALPRAYADRGYHEVWISDDGATDQAVRFVGYLRLADQHGLQPGDYHLQAIDSLLARRETALVAEIRRHVDLELLISDAFLVFGSHLLQGRVNPLTINPEWLANRRNIDMGRVLLDAADQGDFVGALDSLAPRQPAYSALMRALAGMRQVAASGGWERVPDGPALREGDTDPRIPVLRARLRQSGDHPETAGESVVKPAPLLFDDRLAESVRRFQNRHGLEVDGAVGGATLAALNVAAGERVRQIEVNLERWRWLPADLGDRHILVNIPGFSVTVVERDAPVMEMRGIVGRQYRQTPVFSARMTYLVLSPYWHVPPTIAAADKLPEIKKDPGYVAAQRMSLLDAATNRPLDATSVDWSNVTGPEFNRRFRLRQDPGPSNALGDVKFMFPNPHNVYLHDTPSRELFGRTERSFSSGCIRIERPLDLAEYLLRGDPGWDRARIEAAVGRRTEATVMLPDPVPVHIQYWTAWVGRDGLLHFRRDLYGRDAVVHKALVAHAPGT